MRNASLGHDCRHLDAPVHFSVSGIPERCGSARIAPTNAAVVAITVLLLGFGGTAGFVGPGAGR